MVGAKLRQPDGAARTWMPVYDIFTGFLLALRVAPQGGYVERVLAADVADAGGEQRRVDR
jgi:hypothetical protein